MHNLQPIDIAERISRRFPVWEQKPEAGLVYESLPGFGILRVGTPSWELEWHIYVQDPELVIRCCKEAIQNFSQLLNSHWN